MTVMKQRCLMYKLNSCLTVTVSCWSRRAVHGKLYVVDIEPLILNNTDILLRAEQSIANYPWCVMLIIVGKYSIQFLVFLWIIFLYVCLTIEQHDSWIENSSTVIWFFRWRDDTVIWKPFIKTHVVLIKSDVLLINQNQKSIFKKTTEFWNIKEIDD